MGDLVELLDNLEALRTLDGKILNDSDVFGESSLSARKIQKIVFLCFLKN